MNTKRFKNRANKVLKEIKKQNFSQSILLSFNYEHLIQNIYSEIEEKDGLGIEPDEYYFVLRYIIDKCTTLNSDNFTFLYYGGAATKELLEEALRYKSSFNFQMAQYFDEDII